ncbi:amino acid adenylation domain-containing protein [Streptomyces griseochromogenes]|uniref:Amino acid adenylation domain-containing protein n=1 Tax=Streptomyces griseochromogenes TaxID=68214 RepID=A0A1B1ATZ6_9ACTN|nr:amino acid adenylation domain-containing protein [Streptomyces griseochromogenes]ANP50036.1 peptide synthetase [Streptomyces griseochromogenes]MBP2048355.1 amino acid adenylation domain-containing protein [Streptomyces griseochromogenes]
MILQGKRVALPSAPVVHKQFEAHVKATPDAVAVVCAGQRVTYAELDARANRFAHFLAARGHGRGAKVGVCLDYSTDMLVAILGTLKAGAAYVPLDPAYPAARLQLLLGQIPGLALIVASPATAGLVESAAAEVVDPQQLSDQPAGLPTTSPDVSVTGDDVCYAVFTSGSTGTPKLTAVRHEGWFNLMNWLMLEYGLDRGSHNLVVSAFGFDLSQRSLMTPLFCGATQYLMASRNFDALMAYRMLTDHGIRTVHCASSTLYLLVDWETARGGEALTRLDYVLFGGEPLKVERIADWARREGNRCTLLHQYGVAECTDVATSYDLAEYRPGEHDIPPVGRPVHNTEIHILDEGMRGVGEEEYGEVCISGSSVGAGYLNGTGPESEKFTTVTVDGEPRRLYRTGDRGYVTRAGELVVVGRMDAQVKVRGMRIDPTDIERALGRLAGVREAAVVIGHTDAGEVELVAFIVPSEGELAESDVRARLLRTLPRNMVPARCVNIPRLPLSPHGKVDRKALVDACRNEFAVRGTTA